MTTSTETPADTADTHPTVTLSLSDQGGQISNTFFLPEGKSAEQMARRYLVMKGRVGSVDRPTDGSVIYSLRDKSTGRELHPDEVVTVEGPSAEFEIVHTDVPGSGA